MLQMQLLFVRFTIFTCNIWQFNFWDICWFYCI